MNLKGISVDMKASSYSTARIPAGAHQLRCSTARSSVWASQLNQVQTSNSRSNGSPSYRVLPSQLLGGLTRLQKPAQRQRSGRIHPKPSGPGVSLYLTLFGIVAGFLSTFWTFGYVRLGRKLRAYVDAGPAAAAQRIQKSDVLARLERGVWINVMGLGATLLGLQATVGLLVAKTLTNATANPFLSGGAGAYNPVVALDVFLVQASTNTLLAHFVSLFFTLWLVRIVSKGGGPSGKAMPVAA